MLFHYLMGYVALRCTNSTPSPLHVRNTTSQTYPRPLESESLILLGLCNLCCKEPSRWFSYILNLTPAGLDLSKHNTRKKKYKMIATHLHMPWVAGQLYSSFLPWKLTADFHARHCNSHWVFKTNLSGYSKHLPRYIKQSLLDSLIAFL